MPKGIPNKKKEEVAVDNTLAKEIVATLKSVNERLNRLETPVGLAIPAIVQEPAIVAPEAPVEPVAPSMPVPSDFVDVVNTTLNTHFICRIEYFTDRPEFMFTIIVPATYSQEPQPDLRSKVLNNADGINGVRAWAEKVYSSFNHVVQAQIKNDL